MKGRVAILSRQNVMMSGRTPLGICSGTPQGPKLLTAVPRINQRLHAWPEPGNVTLTPDWVIG